MHASCTALMAVGKRGRYIHHGSLLVCRHQDELFFVSERDGNMELYSRRVKNEMSSKHSYQRMTFDPSLQVRMTFSTEAALSFTLELVIGVMLTCCRCVNWHARTPHCWEMRLLDALRVHVTLPEVLDRNPAMC